MWYILLVLFCLAGVRSEFVTKKFCKDVDQAHCTIYSVSVDPCTQGPAYCSLKNGKKYSMTLDLTPKFSAEKMMVAIKGDIKNDGSFSRELQGPKTACGYLHCPVEPEERRIFDLGLRLEKTISGKFPIQVKLWNDENEAQACCFTFNVKI